MPVLHLTEDEVRGVLTMETAIEAVEAGLRKMALEEAFNVPRSRCQVGISTIDGMPIFFATRNDCRQSPDQL